MIRDEPLQIVAVLETRRTVHRLTSAAGEDLAEVADDEVTGRVPGREPAAWREVEVELVNGGPEVLAASGLAGAGGRGPAVQFRLQARHRLRTDSSDSR